MLEENQRQQDQQQQQPPQQATSNSSGKKLKSNRRSLFSVLFKSSSSSNSNKTVDEQDEANNNNGSIDAKESDPRRSEPKETDSYVLDLNDRLVQEKQLQQQNSNKLQPTIQTVSIPPNQDNQLASKTTVLRNKSPMLEEFIEKHRLEFLRDDEDEDSGQDDIISERQLKTKLINNETILRKPTVNHPPPLQRQTTNDLRDMRLINWRLLAASNSNSQQELTDSELEDELDRISPALVITCSDDTSCSSVELIWSPRSSSSIDKSLISNDENFRPANRLLSPNSLNANQSIALSQSTTTSPSSPHHHQSFLSREKILHKLSIFELAKPIKAKGKRFGLKSKSSYEDGAKVSPERDWVANPLFSDEDDYIELDSKSKLSEQASNLMMHDSASSSLSLSTSIDLEDANESEEEPEFRKKEEKRPKLKRWSIRRKKLKNQAHERRKSMELAGLNNYDNSESDSFKRDNNNTYLNHIINLDRKIKTNVSSLKLKLSDTSKRASILADHLITSIKDTTKEQFQNGNRLVSSKTMPKKESSSFYDDRHESASNLNDESDKKAKLFSLIYMHQQQQANGRPVITKQPMSLKDGLNVPIFNKNTNHNSNRVSVATLNSPLPDKEQEPENRRNVSCENLTTATTTTKSEDLGQVSTEEKVVEAKSISKDEAIEEPEKEPERQEDQAEVYKTANSNQSINSGADRLRNITDITQELKVDSQEGSREAKGSAQVVATNQLIKDDISAKKKKKYRKRRKKRKQNEHIKPASDDDDDAEFYHKEYSKLRSTLDRKDDSNNNDEDMKVSRRLGHSQLRSLNYWTRFRMRKLGIYWKLPKPIQRSKSMDF